jgi:hypothetical protein
MQQEDDAASLRSFAGDVPDTLYLFFYRGQWYLVCVEHGVSRVVSIADW